MKKKVLLFDLDDTLSEQGSNISIELVNILNELSNKYIIGVVSGKSILYLLSFIRFSNLNPNIFLVGENGGEGIYPSTLPTKYSFTLQNKYEKLFNTKKEYFINKYQSNIYHQKTQTSLSFCVNQDYDLELFFNEFKNEFKNEHNLNIYEHHNDRAIDAIPNSIDKAIGITKILKDCFNLKLDDCYIYSFGNGSNDIPFFNISNEVTIIGNLKYSNKNIPLNRIKEVNNLADYLKKLF